MRRTLVLLHRWCGLFIAVFLFIAGLTGAPISWDHELAAWLNPRLWYSEAANGSQLRPALELANELERREPKLRVRFMPLHPEPGHALLMSVGPRPDPATGTAYELDYNQLALDPHSGELQAKRMWGAVS